MDELGLVGNLAVVAIAALIGGSVARLLRLPTILGYLAAGIVIGPNTPGFVGETAEVQSVANLGVALLLFTLGIRFSLRELLDVKGLALGGGLGQVGAMTALGFALGLTLGLDTEEALLVGAITSISSTMITLRVLEEGGEIGGPAGKVGVVFTLTQDLVVVGFIVLIPIIGGEDGDDALADAGLAVAQAAGLVAGVWIVGVLVAPWVLSRVALARSRELFLISVVALALGTASVSFLAGLSLAFGAFLAGLVISESEYAHRTLAEVFPLREVFAVVFFVAVGMLIEPASFVDDPDIVFGVALLGILGKLALVTGLAIGFGFSRKAAFTAGLALANMGEFSFVLLDQAAGEGLLEEELNAPILAAVLLSIAVSPVLMRGREFIFRVLESAPLAGGLFEERIEAYVGEDAPANHVVICGFYQAGRELAEALAVRGFRYVVIDDDPAAVRELRGRGVPVILGDPSLPAVLEQAGLERARVLAVTLADVAHGQAVVATARQLNPELDVIVRGDGGHAESHAGLREAGAAEVVHAEFEVGLEFVRHTLHRFGVASREVQTLLARRRRDHYTR